jgi:hypothetical protein
MIIKNLVKQARELGFTIDEEAVFYELGNKTPSLYIYKNNIEGLGIEGLELTSRIGAGRFSYLGGGIMGGVSTSDELQSGTKKQKEAFTKLLGIFERSFLELELEYLERFDDEGDDILDVDGFIRL